MYIYIIRKCTDNRYTLLNLVETPTKKEMHLELQGGEGFKLVTVRTRWESSSQPLFDRLSSKFLTLPQ